MPDRQSDSAQRGDVYRNANVNRTDFNTSYWNNPAFSFSLRNQMGMLM